LYYRFVYDNKSDTDKLGELDSDLDDDLQNLNCEIKGGTLQEEKIFLSIVTNEMNTCLKSSTARHSNLTFLEMLLLATYRVSPKKYYQVIEPTSRKFHL